MHVEVDRETDAGELDELREPICARARATCAPRSRTGRRCATRARDADRRARARRRRRRPRRGRGGQRAAARGSPTTTSRSSATASTTSPRTARTAARGRRAPASASCARRAPSRVVDASRSCRRRVRALRARAAPARCSPRRTRARPCTGPRYLDYIGVKRFDATGEVVGERRFLGLYTSRAYSARPRDDPGAAPQGRRRCSSAPASRPAATTTRRCVEILETTRATSCSRSREDELYETAIGHPRPRRAPARAAVRAPRRATGASSRAWSTSRATASTPPTAQRDRGDPARGVRRASSSTATLHLSESVLARCTSSLRVDAGRRCPTTTCARSRRARRARRAVGRRPARRAGRGARRGARRRALPRATATRSRPPTATTARRARRSPTSQRIEELDAATTRSTCQPLPPARGARRARCASSSTASARRCRSRTCCRCSRTWASSVADERPTRSRRATARRVWIYDFGLDYARRRRLDADAVRDALRGGVRARLARRGRERRLQPARARAPGSTWREVDGAARRSQATCARSASRSARRYIEQTLAAHPDIARAARRAVPRALRPGAARDGDAARSGSRAQIEQALDAVDEPRRGPHPAQLPRARAGDAAHELLPARRDGAPKPYLSFKLDPTQRPDLPLPRPLFEIFVYSPRVEGVHLRGGKVARGGIRWSDRREDFRTEVLGLMKAQMVKNAVIVPVGAKGGFVVKQPPPRRPRRAAGRGRSPATGRSSRGLLDITDNLVGGEVVPPPRRRAPRRRRPVPRRRRRQGHGDVLRHRQRDRGRVRLLARRRVRLGRLAPATTTRRWASPRAARGSRSSATSASSGIDIQTRRTSPSSASATCRATCSATACCCRAHIRLVAAFDHRHVFLDPDPDPAASFAERERLFELPRSSWADYDAALISEGGGVFPRTAKSIPLSPEARAALGIDAERADADRADPARSCARRSTCSGTAASAPTSRRATETHADVGDRANDALRVDGARAALPGRRRGRQPRLHAARARSSTRSRGGRDQHRRDRQLGRRRQLRPRGQHQDPARRASCADGDLTVQAAQRAARRDDRRGRRRSCCATTTRRRRRSSLAARAGAGDARRARPLHARPRAGRAARPRARVPARRRGDRRAPRGAASGSTQPELAVAARLQRRSTLYATLLDSDLPDDPSLAGELERYFPTPLPERFARRRCSATALRREIIATQVANDMVNRARHDVRLPHARGDRRAAGRHRARLRRRARRVRHARAVGARSRRSTARVAADDADRDAARRPAAGRARRRAGCCARGRGRSTSPPTVERFARRRAALAEALPGVLVDAEREALARARAASSREAGVPEALAGARRRRSARSSPRSTSSRSRRATERSTSRRSRRCTSCSAARLDLHWLRDRIARCRATTAGRRWRAPRCATTSSRCTRELTADVLRVRRRATPVASASTPGRAQRRRASAARDPRRDPLRRHVRPHDAAGRAARGAQPDSGGRCAAVRLRCRRRREVKTKRAP